MNGEGFIVIIDREVCTGQGRCFTLAPEVFAADGEGFGTVTAGVLPEGDRAKLERVVQLCPELAIRIEDAGTASPGIDAPDRTDQ